MRFRLETTDRAPFWLIGDPAMNPRTEGSPAMDADMQLSRNMQGISGAEWDGQLFFDRKNQKVSISATGWRFFETEVERMDFIQSLTPENQAELAHLWEGTVYVRLDTATGYKEWPLRGAVISLVGTRLQGEGGLYLNYRIHAPSIGTVITSTLCLPLFRCNLAGASVSVTVADLTAAETTHSLENGDWVQIALISAAGESLTMTFIIGDYGLTLPLSVVSLAVIEALAEAELASIGWPGSAVQVITALDPDPEYLRCTAPGEGELCFAAFRIGRGATVLWEVTDQGNEDQLPLLLQDYDLTMTMNVSA